ncbi:MAG: DinB family protein [Anaerolineae bacterium]|nr:DinB family protein [Anaerolineae bacterium]
MVFENLYQELARGLEIIPLLVTDMTQAAAQVKPDPDSWSALEVICHLYDEEREDFRQRLDIMLHRPQEPWPPIDPQGWVTARQYNQRDLAKMVEKFKAERNQSLVWLKGLSAPNWEAEYTNQWGSMKAGDMFAAWVAHDNLHTRQLVELRRHRLLNLTTPYDVGYAGNW